VVGLWIFGVILVIIPIAAHGSHVWMPSVGWVCFPLAPRLVISRNRY
jgi:hypothetical protein